MQNLDALLFPRPPFADVPVAPAAHCGVIASDRDGLGVAVLLIRRDKRAALAQRLREHFGIELPTGAHRTTAGPLALLGTGPGAWLATFERGSNAFAARLREAVGELAAVSDQSDGSAVLRLSGANVRDALIKLVPIDLHPRVFSVGDVASTVAGHIAVTLWRLGDQKDESPVFEISMYRSVARCFWEALLDSAAEFGFEKREFERESTMISEISRGAPIAVYSDTNLPTIAAIEARSP